MATARAATPHKSTDPSPTKWDPRIVEYVKFVEKERGLKFEHPIPVDFLSDKKFVKTLKGDDQKPTKAERTSADHYAGQMRALGLIEGDVDLIGANRDLDAATITGFYSDKTRHMVIRGTDITDVVTRVTVVHELTHALQDQHFDLHKLNAGVRDSGEDFALTALIEGDARYVEEAYYFSLTPEEQDEYDNWDPTDNGAPAAPDETSKADIPPVLDLIQSAPYTFGLRFIAFLDNVDGTTINQAFSKRPLSEENIIDPVSYALHEKPRKVASPDLVAGNGEKADGPVDVMGAFSLYVVLAARIDPKLALAASEGWGGDSYLPFRQRGTECVRIDVVGDTVPDSTEIADAFDEWGKAMPTNSVSVKHEGTHTKVTACDSTATAPTVETLDAAVTQLIVRNEVLIEVAQRTKLKPARCVADRSATDPQLAPLFDKSDLTDAEKAVISTKVREFLAACTV